MKRIAFCLAFAAFALPALAQQGHQGHGARPSANEPASTREFRAANDKMHRDMNILMTGNADVDFVQGMIPHHQGAVDMAKIVLQYGADPEIKKIAQEIIAAQEKEIAMFRAWLAKRQK
jgi:uncharacterized protein (DUF305 family)